MKCFPHSMRCKLCYIIMNNDLHYERRRSRGHISLLQDRRGRDFRAVCSVAAGVAGPAANRDGERSGFGTAAAKDFCRSAGW